MYAGLLLLLLLLLLMLLCLFINNWLGVEQKPAEMVIWPLNMVPLPLLQNGYQMQMLCPPYDFHSDK